jgi:DNA ligase-1
MRELGELSERVRATTKKLEKVSLVAEYLRAHVVEESALAAVYLSARPFPAHEETILNVGGSLISRVVSELAPGGSLNAAYRKFGDLGEAAGELLARRKGTQPGVSLAEVDQSFRAIAAARGQSAKADLLKSLLERATALEATYLIKIMTGDLRIGLRESLVEEAIAKSYEEAYSAVRRANMLLGDIGQTVKLAADHRLGDARMKLFHPIGMMLASPVENAEQAFEYFTNAAVEDKFDGIRAQVHADGQQVRLFSRTLDDVTGSFPELAASLMAIKEPVIVDGEILAWSGGGQDGRALPFSRLQQRLGRKTVSAQIIQEVPVAFIAFDVIYARGDLTIELPWRERRALLESIFTGIKPRSGAHEVEPVGGSSRQSGLFDAPESADGVAYSAIVLSEDRSASSPADLERLFDEAQARGNEGLMIKDPDSPYAPGRRGKSWLKLKRELATLDVVVTGVEWGNGKRADVLSDYTFAVRDGDQLVNVGKAYSGLTDAEIATMTAWFKEHTLSDLGHFRTVEPKIVLEVAFNNVMESNRHESGYALRFPRIVRIRDDKPVSEIDTVERVKELFEIQHRTAA